MSLDYLKKEEDFNARVAKDAQEFKPFGEKIYSYKRNPTSGKGKGKARAEHESEQGEEEESSDDESRPPTWVCAAMSEHPSAAIAAGKERPCWIIVDVVAFEDEQDTQVYEAQEVREKPEQR